MILAKIWAAQQAQKWKEALAQAEATAYAEAEAKADALLAEWREANKDDLENAPALRPQVEAVFAAAAESIPDLAEEIYFRGEWQESWGCIKAVGCILGTIAAYAALLYIMSRLGVPETALVITTIVLPFGIPILAGIYLLLDPGIQLLRRKLQHGRNNKSRQATD